MKATDKGVGSLPSAMASRLYPGSLKGDEAKVPKGQRRLPLIPCEGQPTIRESSGQLQLRRCRKHRLFPLPSD